MSIQYDYRVQLKATLVPSSDPYNSPYIHRSLSRFLLSLIPFFLLPYLHIPSSHIPLMTVETFEKYYTLLPLRRSCIIIFATFSSFHTLLIFQIFQQVIIISPQDTFTGKKKPLTELITKKPQVNHPILCPT